jgi:hypothetical protein
MKETSKTVLALAAAALLAACGGGEAGVGDAVQAKSDANELEAKLVSARLCDISGCYLAWNVVDSDKDGVCDADELMAGTDPHDPLSKPSLRVVAELGGKSRLPSFEYGSGAFAVYPEKMQMALQEYYKAKGVLEQAAAFPLAHERGDSLKRAGISAELLKEKGLDPLSDGFTIGLDRPAADSGMPGRRVAGIEVRLISEDPTPLKPVNDHGGAKMVEGFPDGASRVTYNDGFTRTNQSDGTVVWRNEEGKVTKVYPGGGSYVNPDADGGGSTEPTDEQKKAFERVRGAAILTVDNWEQPEISDEKVQDPRALIMLVDPLIADMTGMVFDAPRVTTAQPEGVPDMPRPTIPAGGVPGGPKGGCPVEGFTSGDC